MERTEIYNQFEELNKRASQGGGIDKIEKQHAAGRMTARERIEALLDKGTFKMLDKFEITVAPISEWRKNKFQVMAW